MKRSLIASSVLALLLTACGATETANTNTIKLGLITPLTGDLSTAGADVLAGATMAVAEINAAGGVGGKQVELIAEDGRCNGADGTNAAQKLVNVDKVVGIVGGSCSSETLAAAPIAEAAKVVMISPLSSSPDVTTAGEYVFRNYPSDGLKGKALGAYLQKAGYTKLAIISENTDFCQGIRSAVIKDLPQGISVVFSETVDPGARDFRTLLGRLKDTKFDVFLANAQSDAGVAEMAKQMRELGIKQPIVGTDTADSLTLVKLAGDAVEGLKPLSVPSLDEADAMGGAFAKNFRAKNGEPKFGMFFAALSYDATKLLAETIGKAGTGENLKNALYNVKGYKGVSGTFSFDKNGDVVGIPFAMKEFKDGKLMQSELIPLQ